MMWILFLALAVAAQADERLVPACPRGPRDTWAHVFDEENHSAASERRVAGRQCPVCRRSVESRFGLVQRVCYDCNGCYVNPNSCSVGSLPVSDSRSLGYSFTFTGGCDYGYSTSVSGSCRLSSGSIITAASYARTASSLWCYVSLNSPATSTNDGASDSASFSLLPNGQTVTFSGQVTSFLIGDLYTVTASASSGLGISSYGATGACSMFSSNQVKMNSAGTCSITATQNGDIATYSATGFHLGVTVNKLSQSISYSALSGLVGTSATVVTSATSNLPVSLSAAPTSVCSLSGTQLSFISGGTCTVTYSQAGDATYKAATSLSQPVTVAKASQTITLSASPGSLPFTSSYTPVASASPSLLTVLLTVSGPCSINAQNLVTFTAAGSPCTCYANQAGDSRYAPALQVSHVVNPVAASQSVTVSSTAPASAFVGGPSYTASASAPGGAIVYSASGCTASGNVISFGTAGTCTVTFSQAGNTNYLQASTTQSFTVAKGSQSISFSTSVPVGAIVFQSYTPSASAPGGIVTFSSGTPSVCTVSGSVFSLIASGTCQVRADQSGSGNYNAASTALQSFSVTTASQTISLSAAPSSAVYLGSYSPSASSSSLLAVTITVAPASVCTRSGSVVTFVGLGQCTTTASQSGNSQYSATSLSHSFTVGQAPQTVTITSSAPAATVSGPTYTATGTAPGGGVVVSSATLSICTVASNVVSFLSIGTCTLNFSQAGNTFYLPATTSSQPVTVTQGTQVVTFTSTAPGGAIVNGNYSPTATAPGGSITFSTTTPSICSGTGPITFNAQGLCIVRADQAGNANFAAAFATQSVTVGGTAQTVTISSSIPVNPVFLGAPYNVSATASSGLAVVVAGSGSCTASGLVVSYTGAGSCTVTVTQPGDVTFSAAPAQTQVFTVGAAAQVITISSNAPAAASVGGPTYTATGTAPGGAVTVSSSTFSVCTVSGNIVTFVAAGTCTISFAQAGGGNYLVATPVPQTFSVARGAQVISFSSSAPVGALVFSTYAMAASASGGGAVTFSSGSPTICTVAANTATMIATGTCSVRADQNGTADFLAAPQASQSFFVTVAAQTISFTSQLLVGVVYQGTPYTPTATSTSGLSVSTSAGPAGVCVKPGTTVTFVGVGSCTVTATQPGNSQYGAGTPVTQVIAVAQSPQAITIVSNPGLAVVGGAPYSLSAAAPGGTVVFSILTPAICSLSAGDVSFIAVGTCTVGFNQAGGTNYLAAPQVTQSITVSKGSQIITFTSAAPGGATVAGPTFTVTATAPGGTVTFVSSTLPVCTLSGSVVSFVAAGTCTLVASQSGSADYFAAPSSSLTFSVSPGTQTVSFTSSIPVGAFVGGATYAPTGTASSALPVLFGSASTGVCTVSGGVFSFVAPGTCVVTADQPGSADYNAAGQVSQSFGVGKGSQTLSFSTSAPVAATVAGTQYSPAAVSSVGLIVSLGVSTPLTCTLSAGSVSFISSGFCVITANQAGNAVYNASAQIIQNFTVARATQTVSFTSAAPSAAQVGGTGYVPTAVSTSGLSVTITVDPSASSVCSITSGVVSFAFVGTCVLDVNQPGSGAYFPANQGTQSFGVGLQQQAITLTSTPPTTAVVSGATYSPTATASSGLAVTFSVSPTTVCTLSGGVISMVGAGSCLVAANQDGNGQFNAAPQMQQSFTVGRGSQTLSFSSSMPAGAVVGGVSYTPVAVSSRGLIVTLSIDASSAAVCVLASGSVTYSAVGTCRVNADQGGSSNFAAATQVFQNFTVGKGPQTITFSSSAPTNAVVAGATYATSATSTSGLSVALSIAPASAAVCSITAGNVVSFLATGTCIINADQAGNANYLIATQAVQSFAVGKGAQMVTFTSTAPVSAVVAGATYNVAGTVSSGLAISITVNTPVVCSISGQTVSFLTSGNCVLNGNQAGDLNYNAAAQVQQSFFVGKGVQTVSFSSLAPTATAGGAVYVPIAASSVGLTPVTFSTSTPTICSVSGGVVSFSLVGSCAVLANQAGSADYLPAAAASQIVTVTRGVQNITFVSVPAPDAAVGDTYTASASATSGLIVTFAIDSNSSAICSISGTTITLLSRGQCKVNADQAGSVDFAAAPRAVQSFGVGLAQQTLTITSVAPAASVRGATYTPAGTATSGLPVLFSIDPSSAAVCAITGGVVSFTKTGTCVVVADQSGDINYNFAPQVAQVVTVAPGSQTVSFSTTPNSSFVGGATYSPLATSDKGLLVAFSVSPPAVCSLSNGVVSFLTIGSCQVNADQAGNADFNAAARVTQSISVGKGSQTIAFSSLAPVGAQVAGATYSVVAGASSGRAVTVTSTTTAVCTISSNIVSFVAAGNCILSATESGDGNWNAATPVTQTFTVFKGTQSVSFTSSAPSNAVVGGSTYTVTATSSAGLSVTFSIDSSAAAVCTISGATVSFIGSGTCVINGGQIGDANYNPASPAQHLVSVGRGTQTVTFTSSIPNATVAVVDGLVFYNPAATSSVVGLPITFSIAASSSSICSIANGAVSYQSAGSCIVQAQQLGTANYMPSLVAIQSFSVGRGAQIVSFESAAPGNPFVNGSSYSVIAVSTSHLLVSISATSASSSICVVSGTTVSFIGNGTCTLQADQAGDANYVPAASVFQSFAVSLEPIIIIYQPVDLYVCPTASDCSTVTSGLLGPNLAVEANASSTVVAAIASFATCTALPQGNGSDWLSDCNVALVRTLFGLNSGRVDNLNVVLTSAYSFRSSCTTQSCRDVLGLVIDSYTPIAVAAATTCNTTVCQKVASGSASGSATAIWTGAPDALLLEKKRFDSNIASQALQQLQIDTFAYASCTTDSCRSEAAARTNVSFAIMGYVNQAKRFGMVLANSSLLDTLVTSLDTNFTKCVLQAGCSFEELNFVYRTKRAMLRYLVLWNSRLQELTASCVAPVCDLSAERAATDRNTYLMTDYVPLPILIPGFLFYAVLVIATTTVGVLAFLWQSYKGKEIYLCVLIGVLITACLRIALWAVALQGVGTASLTFVILDKLSSLFFALTILVFVYMWGRAIAILMEVGSIVTVVLGVVAVAVAAAVTAVSIYYAINISRNFVTAYYGVYVADYAEIVLAAFTLVLVLCLFVFTLIVGIRLRRFAGGSASTSSGSAKNSNGAREKSGKAELQASVDEKLKNLRIIIIAVGVMVVFLIFRFILVVLRNFAGYSLGYVTFYGVATVIPEVICCLIMLGMVLFTFYQSRHVSLSKLQSNASYQSGNDKSNTELQRFGPSSGDRYDI